MTNVEARLKVKGKNFEILVDVDKALQMKKGEGVNIQEVLAAAGVFYDSKKGLKVSDSDLQECFGTTNINEVSEQIVKKGEVQLPQEYRDKKREDRAKQVIDFLAKNASDPKTGNVISPERIKEALEQTHINIDDRPVETQIAKIIEKLREVIPIKIETKKLSITIPAVYTGQVYGIINEYKEKEDWQANGDLVAIINLPSGLQMDFYDKLNAVTHGSAVVEELKEKE